MDARTTLSEPELEALERHEGTLPEALPLEEQRILARLHKAERRGYRHAAGIERARLRQYRRRS